MTIAQVERPTQAKSPIANKRLRILFLSPFAPGLQASHGGGRAIGQLITNLSQKHAVALCYLRAYGEPAVDEAMMECCDVVEEVQIPATEHAHQNGWLRRLRVYIQLLAGKPLWAMDRFHPEFERRVKILLRSWQPDMVQIEFHIMGQYLSALKGYPAPRVLVQHEPGTEAIRDAVRSHVASGHIVPRLDLLAWKRFERQVMQQVESVVVFTDRDRDSIRKRVKNIPVVRIPLGTETSERSSAVAEDPSSLLFVGNFKHLPNREAADRLINRIFPRVQAAIPDARLYVVGDHLPSAYRDQKRKNVICTGYVPDVKPYLDQASVVVAPIGLGGGMRVKVLEALAAGKAMVASARAIEGLDIEQDKHVILADSDDEFSRAIIDLLQNPQKRDLLAKQARTWAQDNLSWDKTVQMYEDLYRQLLENDDSSRK